MKQTIVAVLLTGLFTALAHAAPATALDEKRQLLADHQTVAQFEGADYQLCRNRTALCPDRCGHSGEFAKFKILAYTTYAPYSQYAQKQDSFTIQVSDVDRQPKGDPALLATVRTLKRSDFVQLSWHHDYVTVSGASFPYRPVTKLEKCDPQPAQKLIDQAKATAAANAAKITLDLTQLDSQGLRGKGTGKVAVGYEFAIPDTPDCRDRVKAIDPSVQFMPNSPGRVGAGKDQWLCIGSTHQQNYREVLSSLSCLPFVARIIQHDAE